MRGNTCLHTRNVPPAWTDIIRFHASSDHSSIGPNAAWPAALSTQSIDPSSSSVASTAARTDASSDTSAPIPMAPSMSPAISLALSASRSTIATRPPLDANRRAVAAAIPDPPPVANSTFPSKSIADDPLQSVRDRYS